MVENNIDLLPENDHFDPSFEEFWKNNGYIKGFRVSAKTGENVQESMEYLIKKIIKRMEIVTEKAFEDENEDTTSPEGNSVSLESKASDKECNKINKCILF